MPKKYLSLIIICIILIILFIMTINKNKSVQNDQNTLYSISFSNIKLRVKRYDYVLGQNQIVGVERSTDNGKTYKKITTEAITVSLEPKFIFINEKLGFAIAKPDLYKSNNYKGIMVTNDGGKTFVDSKINYENPNIDLITIEDLPYFDKDKLILKCSIYQVKTDHSGYENIDLYFISVDSGLTWSLE